MTACHVFVPLGRITERLTTEVAPVRLLACVSVQVTACISNCKQSVKHEQGKNTTYMHYCAG